MTCQDILNDIDTRVKNSISTAQKVKWINQSQRKFYQDFPLPETVYMFTTANGVALYDLPADCPENRIVKITVDGETYDYQTLHETAAQKGWTIISGQLFLWPTPESETEVMIYCKPRPDDFSVSDTSKESELPEDFHELVVLDVAIRVSFAIGDLEKKRELEMDLIKLGAAAKKGVKKPTQRTVTVLRR
ncbi:MAG TPA: hypothetical protein EYP63_06055 [Desulfotomaculum sp.]|nr:hypothetical protein [Desulfotomaculum sp.]